MSERNYNPDVLSCLANLSSDEVFTSPKLANQILDIFPQEIFESKQTKFLDPCTKTGVFLREITKRLIVGLKDEIPNLQKRIDHILTKQVYGIAITELTSLISRRSLYCSKNANSKYSICNSFSNKEGNIYFNNVRHEWNKGFCKYCGARELVYSRGENSEEYAYEFIHSHDFSKIKNMKFDVIIGNPPYQMSTGGRGGQALPIYHKFVQTALKMKPRYLSMIIPSRWYAGNYGGLNEFREIMLNNKNLSHLIDFPNATDCFPPPIEIKSGVCYFLVDSNYNGNCKVTTKIGSETIGPIKRDLNEFDIFIRFNQAIPIIKKVLSKSERMMSEIVSNIQPFGLPTNFNNFEKKQFSGSCKIYARNVEGWVTKALIRNNAHLIDKYKVLISEGYNGGDNFPHQIIGKPFITPKNSCCTMTYIVCGAFENKIEAQNLEKYLKTKFCRFLIYLRKNTQHINKERFKFVPIPNLKKEWTDKDLYKKYDISSKEIEFIDSLIREMN